LWHKWAVAAAPDHRNVVINLPIETSVGEDIPALFPALILTMRHSSTFWGSATGIVVTGCCTVVMIIPSVDFTVTRK